MSILSLHFNVCDIECYGSVLSHGANNARVIWISTIAIFQSLIYAITIHLFEDVPL